MKLCKLKNLAAFACVTVAALSGSAQTASPLDKLPLFFEANQGQAETAASFLARTADAECAISAGGVAMNLRRADGQPSQLRMQFVGANPSAEIHGDAEQAGKVNYLLGNNPAQWHSGVPTFARVRVEKIYPGADLIFYGNQRQLEYDFNFAAGANPQTVALRFDGAEKIHLDAQGDLVISVGAGELRQPQPQIYQTVNGARHAVSGGYKIIGPQMVAFRVGDYDHSLPIVIDPLLTFSTYFGGTAGTVAYAVAVDTNGYIYVAGQTLCSSFSPWTSTNGFQKSYHGGSLTGDAFVAKFDSLGTNLQYLTYLGGKGDDGAESLAIDAQGDVYVAGFTSSTDFPTNISSRTGLATKISGSPVPQLGTYPTDGFVAELNTNGSGLIYSGYLGGSQADAVMSLAIDPASGTAYVTGYTYSTNFPCTVGALSKKLRCPYSLYYNANGFVAEIAPGGTNLNYSTYLGGTNFDTGRAIAFNNGSVFVAGYSSSTNFPTQNPIHQAIGKHFYNGQFLNGSNTFTALEDAFVAAFTNSSAYSTTNLTLLYSTFLGGTNSDIAYGIAADADGDAYVVGATTSGNFPSSNSISPATLSSFLQTNTLGGAAKNAFITQVKWNGTNAYVGYSALFGGAGTDVARAIALDATNNAFVAGYATSTNFPVTKTSLFGSLRATNSGNSDVFVIAFNTNASGLIYSTYLGGSGNDYAYGIAVDSEDSAYVVGQTFSTNFPVFNARQKTLHGTNDAFLAKIILDDPPKLTAGFSGSSFMIASPPVELQPNTHGLETSTSLDGTNWTAVTQTPTLSNGTNLYKFNPTNRAQFFRYR